MTDLLDDLELKEYYGRLGHAEPPPLPVYRYRCTDTGNITGWPDVTQAESDAREAEWGDQYKAALMSRRVDYVITNETSIDELEAMASRFNWWPVIICSALSGTIGLFTALWVY